MGPSPELPQKRLGGRRDFDGLLVGEAPAPTLVRLERGDDRVLGLMVVPGRVPVRRAVAAADVATRQAQSQMHPSAAGLHAFFTPQWGAWRNGPESGHMRTGHRSRSP